MLRSIPFISLKQPALVTFLSPVHVVVFLPYAAVAVHRTTSRPPPFLSAESLSLLPSPALQPSSAAALLTWRNTRHHPWMGPSLRCASKSCTCSSLRSLACCCTPSLLLPWTFPSNHRQTARQRQPLQRQLLVLTHWLAHSLVGGCGTETAAGSAGLQTVKAGSWDGSERICCSCTPLFATLYFSGKIRGAVEVYKHEYQ